MSSPGSEPVGPSGGRRALRRAGWVLAGAAALLALDALRPPADQLSARVALAAIDAYQATLSGLLPHLGVSCRFEPTCSRYTEAAIRSDGAVVGAARGLGRIVRCGPWVEAGTVDPP